MTELSRRQFLTGTALATAGEALTLGGCAPKGSGASLSSMAYLTAVAEALDKAGEKSSEWKKHDKALQWLDNDIPTWCDVVVVGAGGAGFTASISAANKGKKVLLMEKLGVFGGSTALSGGEMAVPGNWIQKNSGLEDSPELLAADTMAHVRGRRFLGAQPAVFRRPHRQMLHYSLGAHRQRHDTATDHACAIHRQHHAHRQHESHRSRTRFRWKDQRDKGSERRHGR